MAAQPGRDILLKIFDDQTVTSVTVAGLRTKRISLNAQSIDITDAESAGRWRELMAGGGLRRVSVSGSGIFKDQASDERVRQLFFDGIHAIWQLVIPSFGTLDGPFAVTALDYGGSHDGEVTFDLALESAGAVGFEALP